MNQIIKNEKYLNHTVEYLVNCLGILVTTENIDAINLTLLMCDELILYNSIIKRLFLNIVIFELKINPKN